MGEKVSWYPLTKIVQITQAPVDVGGEDQVNFNVKTDLYSDGKEDWIVSGELSKFVFPVRGVGGQDLPGEKLLGSTYFLDYGWRIRPYEESHVFNVNGNLYTDTGNSPFTQTLGTYNVMTIQQVSSLVDSTVAQLSEIEFMAFGNNINIDVSNGETGTVYPLGTEEHPVNNWDDALIISDNMGINRFQISGALNISGDLSNKTFRGLSPSITSVYILPGSPSSGSFFERVTLSGEFSGEGTITRDCYISEISNFEGLLDYSFLMGPIGLKNQGSINLLNCFDGIIGDDSPIIDINGSNAHLSIHNYHGSLKLINKTGGESIEVRMTNGVLILDSTITSGEILVEGVGRFINNSTGDTVVNSSGLLDPPQIIERIWNHERAESILYDGVGVIDVVNGEAGTTPPIGTPKRPSNNLTDALSIISGENINKILLRSDITVESYHDIRNLAFETHGSPIVTVTLEDGCLVHNSSFRYIHLQGTISGEQYMLLEACAIDNLTNFNGFMNLVAFSQGSELSIGEWGNLIDCHAGGEPGNEPEIDIGSSNLKLQKYTGNVKFTNKTGSNRTIANFSSGNVIIDSTCVAGKIQLLGVGDLEADNSGVGCSVDTDSFISNKFIADHVLDEAISEHLAVGSLGDYIAKTLGLSQDKYYLDQTVYSTYNGIKLLTSGRIRTYTNPASIGTDADVLATYTITAVWNNDELQSYKVVPI